MAAETLFGSAPISGPGLDALRGIVPETAVSPAALATDEPVVDALVASGLCSSRGEARRAIGQGGIRVNGDRVASEREPVGLIGGRYALIQRGRKQRHLLVIA